MREDSDLSRPVDPLADARLAAIVDSSFDAIIGKDLNSVITTWNRAAERLFGYTEQEAIGRSIRMLIPEDLRSEEDLIIGRIRGGERIETYETTRLRKDGSEIFVSLTVSPIRNRDGIVVGASKIARDITEAKEHERRVSLLLREVHHRVKNNLQTVASLVQLHQMPEEIKRDLRDRILAMAAVHEHLHRPESTGGVELGDYLVQILARVNESYGSVVRLDLDIEPVLTDADTATSLGLIANELITNTNKYAFPDRRAGTMRLRLTKTGDQAMLTITNDGVSFDGTLKSNGTGIRLIRSLAATINDRFVLEGSEGLRFEIGFAVGIPRPDDNL